jgi:hypothetical protein
MRQNQALAEGYIDAGNVGTVSGMPAHISSQINLIHVEY